MTVDPHRRSPRIAQRFIIRFRAADQPDAGWSVSPLRDLSEGGARFLSEQAFTVGTPLELLLVLPAAPQPIPLRARVAWTKPMSQTLTELGVTFDSMGTSTSQQAIALVVARFLERDKEA